MRLAGIRSVRDVHNLVEKALNGRPIPEVLLKGINREKRLVDAVLHSHDQASFDDLVAEVKYVLKISTTVYADLGYRRKYDQKAAPKSHEETRISTDRQRILSLLVAKTVMESFPSVKRFRMGYLAQSILEPQQVEQWVRAHCSDIMGDIISPQETVFKSLELHLPNPPDQPHCRPYSYWDSAPYYSFIPWWVRADNLGGTKSHFGKLMQVAEDVSIFSGWSFGESVWFILTGESPELPLIRVFSNLVREDGITGPTIVLEVDPEAAPPAVADAYRNRRNELRLHKRNRPLSAKMLAFVEFVIAHRTVKLLEPTDWSPLIEEWNNFDFVRQNEWQFREPARRNISYDFNQALRSLEPQVENYDWSVVSSRIRRSEVEDDET